MSVTKVTDIKMNVCDYEKLSVNTGVKFDNNKAPLLFNYWNAVIGYLNYTKHHNSVSYGNLVHDILRINRSVLANEPSARIIDLINNCIKKQAVCIGWSDVRVIKEVSCVCKYGANKYGMDNYLGGLSSDRLLSAAMRHATDVLLLDITLDTTDGDNVGSGLSHWAHFFSNLFMLSDLVAAGQTK